MPRKVRSKKDTHSDFTINDCANAPKPKSRVKKSIVTVTVTPELAWDQIEEDVDIIEEINEDGTKSFVYKKKRNHSKSDDNIENRPGRVYPEIVWYLISQYIKPEDVGRFAGINRTSYFVTKRESFWRALYKRYSENYPALPSKLRLENSYKLYGLRQRVIRALYYTYKVFKIRIAQQETQDSEPHRLVKRRCVNVWYSKGATYWTIFFKFKKLCPLRTDMDVKVGFLEELGRIDANPEDDCQVLQVTCQSFYDVPPLMGMTLSSLSVCLSQGFRHHRIHLGFTSSPHVSKDTLPECSVVLDQVVKIMVFDWWNPRYPNFNNVLPSIVNDEESLPVLKRDFFTIPDGDL